MIRQTFLLSDAEETLNFLPTRFRFPRSGAERLFPGFLQAKPLWRVFYVRAC